MNPTNIDYENLALLNQPFFEEYKTSFNKVLQSGWYILGNAVKQFEEEFATHNNAQHCVGVASGLDAITLSLAALNFERGAEVIVPSNTYIATILSVMQNNLTPVLVEPDITTYNIDPKKIEEAITTKTKAIVVVHLYGKACEMDKIIALCKKYNLALIEDCAQSHGAKFKNQYTGTFGQYGAFSFYPTKNLGALGDAGAILTNDSNLQQKVRILRNYGSEKKYYNQVVGYNSRLDEMQAAFLSVKLKSLNKINEHKRMLANLYLAGIKNDFIKPIIHDDYFDVYHIFNIRHQRRDELKEFLLKSGIKTEVHYPVPPHKQEALKHLFTGKSFPISEEIHATTLSLPISYFHTKENVMQVIDALNRF